MSKIKRLESHHAKLTRSHANGCRSIAHVFSLLVTISLTPPSIHRRLICRHTPVRLPPPPANTRSTLRLRFLSSRIMLYALVPTRGKVLRLRRGWSGGRGAYEGS